MIAEASAGHSIGSFIVPIGILILSVGWFVLRLTGVVRFQNEPKRDKESSTQSRRAEAVMLLCGSLVIWMLTATNTSTGGRLLLLDQLHPAFARVNVIVAVLSLLGILCSCLIAARWFSSLGVVLCAASLIFYASMLNGAKEWLESFVPEEARGPRRSLHFDLVNCDLPGAELYVNAARLGVLPVTIDQAELVDRVPVWDEGPAALDRASLPDVLKKYRHNGCSLRGQSLYRDIFLRFSNGTEKTYYTQVKHRGQWCYASWDSGSGGGGGGGPYVHHRAYDLNFLSPDYEQRLSQLLDYARIWVYQVPDAWFQTMETYGRQSVIALLEKEHEEWRMKDLLDQWASLRFGLDDVHDEATAWQAFERLCQRVTEAQAYSTEGLEGRAVAWLAPRLPLESLTQKALHLIRTSSFINWSRWTVHGKPHFGTSTHGARFVATDRRIIGQGSWGRNGGQLPIHGYAVAHAMWVRFQQGDAGTGAVLQGSIMAELIAKLYKDLPRYRFLIAVGGPVLERFLLRQNWEADPEQSAWEQIIRLPEGDMNGWFHMLAYLESPVGREFRQTHRERIFQMADPIDLDHSSRDIDFLFLNLDQGRDSLAFQYWPRFLRKIPDYDRRGNQAMKHAIEYLVKMGAVSEPGMYVEVFKAIEQWTFYTMENFEVLSSLPFAHRTRVCEALRQAMAGDISHLGLSGKSIEEARARMLVALETLLASEEQKAEPFYQKLATGKSHDHADKWLQNLDESHAIVPMLAKSDRADLRRRALYAIESHPSFAHRALLEQLLQDTDPDVSTAAEEVKATLACLANIQVETLKAR